MASVTSRAAAGATAVFALALVAAGLLTLELLRDSLDDQVELQAENAVRAVAAQLVTETADDSGSAEAGGPRLPALELSDTAPVLVLAEDGTLLAASEGLEEIDERISAGFAPVRTDPEPSPTLSPEPSVEPTAEPPGGPSVQTGEDDDGAEGESGGDDSDDADDSGDSDDADDAGEEDDGADDDDVSSGSGDGEDEEEDPGPGPGEIGDRISTLSAGATVDGRAGEYLFAYVDVTTPDGQEAVVWAGAPLEVEEAALDSVRASMVIAGPLLIAIVAGIVALVIRRAFRPVEGIRSEMAAITRSQDLSRRVPDPGSQDEIGRLARTTNETLAALETAVDRQRRFVADASHELRSPIASLRTQLEVGEAHPELLDVPGAVQDTVRLQALAADLLLLARLDAGERPGSAEVMLADLITEELAQRRGDRHRVRVAELAEVTVLGSRGQLARVLGNLLDNAQRHAASAVRVSLRRVVAGEPLAVVEVADDGSGVPEADQDRIFERFVRLDDARSRDDGGAGLGLAIARDVAVQHGGGLVVQRAPEGGALFALMLPVS